LTLVGGELRTPILVMVLKDHLGYSTDAAILQQAFLATIRTIQTFCTADSEKKRYYSNNTYIIVASAAAFSV